MTNRYKCAITGTALLFVGCSLQEEWTHGSKYIYAGQITALYVRLSQEDALDGDSNSIVNQKAVLSKYAADNSFSSSVFFIDDDFTQFRNLFDDFCAKDTSKKGRAIKRVQELWANKRRPTKAERQGLFSGLVYCADCGSKLHFATCKVSAAHKTITAVQNTKAIRETGTKSRHYFQLCGRN